jgi:hypothetical protein
MIDPDIDEQAELIAALPAAYAIEIFPKILRDIWKFDAPEEVREMIQDAFIESVNRALARRDAADQGTTLH